VVDLTEGEAPPAVSSAGLTAPPAGSAAQGMCQNDNLRQTAGIKFAHRPKIRFLAPGDSLHRFTSNLAWPTGSWVRLAVQNFTSISTGWNAAPKYQKFPLFGKELPCRGEPLDWFLKNYRGFYVPNYPTLVFHIWLDSLHRLLSYCWETACRSIRPNFSVHPVGKTMRWIKKWLTPFMMARRALPPCKVWGDRIMCASCRCENMVFVTMFFVCHAPRPERCS